MKSLKITLIALIVLCNGMAHAQEWNYLRSATVKAFVSSVFKDKKDNKFIIDNYMNLCVKDSIATRVTQAESKIGAKLDLLKSWDGELIAASDYQIIPYKTFIGDKKRFSGDDMYMDNIYILSINNSPIMYFNFHQEKITSFLLPENEEYGYFLIM